MHGRGGGVDTAHASANGVAENIPSWGRLVEGGSVGAKYLAPLEP